MDDLTKNINDFLSSPDAMAQIQNMLAMLGGGAGQNGTQPQEGQGAANFPPPAGAAQPPPAGGLESLLHNLGAMDLGKIQGLLGAMGNPQQDHKVALLMALRPYLNSKRAAKLDTAVRLLQLSRLSPMLKQLL